MAAVPIFLYFPHLTKKHGASQTKVISSEIDVYFLGLQKIVDNVTISVGNIFFYIAGFLFDIAERNGFKATNKWGYKIKNRYPKSDLGFWGN